ncbi:hypothetical protein BB559_000320 [Furculomyces boomerangus]|uniref:Thioredoxin domain-containing protein n=1 Tax=Furculomyces boomerangus TaxID=61424 RepID=A0A2T9Z5J0_9FUNG|nr:hypothetical protein BB559_000829 [Furculomyces boomerangus]PVU99875.1 hypothetical protein BB559_000320 [Furculomyces boomerangus]
MIKLFTILFFLHTLLKLICADSEENVIKLFNGDVFEKVGTGGWIVRFDNSSTFNETASSDEWVKLVESWVNGKSYRVNKNIGFGEYNCETSGNNCEGFSFEDFPTYVTFLNGSAYETDSVGTYYENLDVFLERMATVKNLQYTPSVILEDKNFARYMAKNTWFIKFYSPKCTYSRSLAPEWTKVTDELYTDMRSKGINFAEVDCLEFGSICQSNKVDGYPTLFLYNDGKKIEEFSGTNDYKSLKEYILKLEERFPLKKTASEKPDNINIDHELSVVDITPENFDKLTSTKPYFIKFFSPRCSHCITLAPTWLKLSEKTGKDIGIGEVNCIKHYNFCNSKKISGYPTLQLFDGTQMKQYSGNRSLESLADFALRLTGSKLETLNIKNFESTLDSSESLYVYFNSVDTGGKYLATIKKVMKQNLKGSHFYELLDTELLKNHTSNIDSAVPHLFMVRNRKFEEYTKSLEKEDEITEWVQNPTKSNLLQLDQKIIPGDVSDKNYFMALIYKKANRDLLDTNLDALIDTATEYDTYTDDKPTITFSWGFYEDLNFRMSTILRLSDTTFPSLVIRSQSNGAISHYSFKDKSSALTVENINDFIEKTIKGNERSQKVETTIPSSNSDSDSIQTYLKTKTSETSTFILGFVIFLVVIFILWKIKNSRKSKTPYIPVSKGV